MGNQNSGRRPGPPKPTIKDALRLWVHELPKDKLANSKSFAMVWTTDYGQGIIEQTEIEFRSIGSDIVNTSDRRIRMYGTKKNKQDKAANNDPSHERFAPLPIIQHVYPKLIDRVGKTRIRFICPRCNGDRFKKLWFYNSHFACRECHGLLPAADSPPFSKVRKTSLVNVDW